nr:MAG: RNA-dependent RNA polymerase [Sanya bunya-like virus 6]
MTENFIKRVNLANYQQIAEKNDIYASNLSWNLDFSFDATRYVLPSFAWAKGLHAIDLGGAGDCFIRGLNFLLMVTPGAENIPRIKTKKLYELLNLPYLSYLEDIHLNELAGALDVTFLTLRLDGDEARLSQIGSSELVLRFLSLGVSHFLPVVSEPPTEISAVMNTKRLPSLLVDTQESLYFKMVHFDFAQKETAAPSVEREQESPESSEGSVVSGQESVSSYEMDSEDEAGTIARGRDINTVCFPKSSDPPIFMAWVGKLESIEYRNIMEVMQSYRYFACEFPTMVSKLESDSLTLSPDAVKACYKFRHNVFSSICKSYLGVFDGKIDTDVPLSSLGLETSKTPDLIISRDGVNVIFEFTVSSKWQNVLYNKGGGLLDLKYSEETDELNKRGIKTTLCIIAAVMEDQNIESIVRDLSAYSDSDVSQLRSDLRSFFSISLVVQPILARLNQVASSFDYSIPSQFMESYIRIRSDLANGTQHEVDLDRTTICVNSDIVASILGRCRRMSENLKKISMYRKDGSCLRMNYDVSNPAQGVRWTFVHVGTDIAAAAAALDSGDISKIFPLIHFHRSGTPVSYGEITGTIPISMKKSQHGPKVSKLGSFDFNLPFDFDYTEDAADLTEFTVPLSELTHNTSVPPDYHSRILDLDIESLMRQDKGMKSKMLVNNSISKDTVKQVVKDLENMQSTAQMPPNLEHHPRQLCMYPYSVGLSAGLDLEYVPVELAKSIIKKPGDKYTSSILSMALEGKFQTTLVKEDDQEAFAIRQEMSKLNTSLFKLLSGSREGEERISDVRRKYLRGQLEDSTGEFKILSDGLSDMNKKYREHIRGKAEAKSLTRLLQLKCKPRSTMDSFFKEEMKHFHKNGSRFLAVDSAKIDTKKVINSIDELMKSMVTPSLEPMDYKLYNPAKKEDSPFMTGVKESLHGNWNKILQEYSRTPLFQSLVLTQSLCKTLFKESCRSYNRDFVKFDNLGFKNVICIVRGGKKIFTKQVSRLFRLAYPVDDLYFEAGGLSENENFQEVFSEGKRYVLTPWMQLHQDVLYDGMTFIYRSFSYLNSVLENSGSTTIESLELKDVLPLLLGMSNRRKTESFMHNVRYLIVNPLGSYSNLKDMISGFAGVNYTYLDLYLRTRLIKNYEMYYSRVVSFKLSKSGFLDDVLAESPLSCIFTGCSILNSYSLVNSIYCTYLMTKAPVNPKLEQASNLLPILKDVDLYATDHGDVNGMDDKSQHMSILESGPSAYDDDFKYDPVFSQHLGVYMGNFLNQSAGKMKIANTWSSCLSSSFDKMANSNGLRGWKKSNFFNKKGYEVIYEFLKDETDVDLGGMVKGYYEMADKQAITMMNQDKYTFWKHYQEMESKKEKILERATFHVVDKIQRGGGREIFVMDIKTKSVQSPVEKFFSRLCRLVPNEMISVPSNKRSNVVHSMFFEKKLGVWVKQILKWVLDCRRWAPHSVFQKYVHFVHGMSHVLPKSFLAQFYFLSEKMMQKRYIVRPSVYDVIKGNMTYSNYLKHMHKKVDPADFFEIDVPFSFVMGIFNYLSSLMHAANQLYASEVIRDWHLKRGKGMVTMSMNAHSDDSAGESQHEDPDSIPTTLGLYDWMLKGANHMLSVKKSQVNLNVYFEFLSILYLKRQMLPVSPKFLSSMPFKPTDNGYSADVMFAVSQSIEAFSQGCSQSESYLLMKLSEKFIQGVYAIPKPTSLSPQLMGGVDSFPLEYMLGGPLTDLWKDVKYNKSLFQRAIHVLRESGIMDREEKIPVVKWDMKSRIPTRHTFTTDLSSIPPNLTNSWFLENCKSDNPVLNIIWYVKKLQDRKYLASLINEPDSRRYSRIFGSAKNRYLMRQDGTRLPFADVYSVFNVLESVEPMQEDISEIERVVELLVGELSNFHDAISQNDFEISNYTSFKRTVKPVRLTASFSSLGSIGDIGANEYIVHKFEPDMFKFFGKTKDVSKSVAYLDNVLSAYMPDKNLSPDLLKPLLNRITGRDNKIYNFINTVDSDIRNLMDHESYLRLFSESVRPNLRLMTDYKRAVALDSSISYSRRGIPQEVRNLISAENARNFFDHWGVLSLDIFKTDLDMEVKDLRSRVPLDWIPYVYHEYTSNTLLSENSFWSIWKKEQKRWSHEWIGEGELVFSVPECSFKIHMQNDIIRLVESDTSDLMEFSQMSSWFLGGIFDKELRVKSQMKSPDTVPDDQVVLGYSHSKKTWGIGFSYVFDLVFDCYSGLEQQCDPILSMEVKWKLDASGRHIAELENGMSYRVKRMMDTEFNKFTDIGQFLDPRKMTLKRNKTVEKMCRECALIQGKNVKYELSTLIDNISKTKIYNICFKFSKANEVSSTIVNDSLLDAFVEYKKSEPTFGFPTKEEIVELSANPWKATMPSSIQEYAYKLGMVALTDSELEYAYNIISTNENSDIEMVLADLRMLYGEASAVQNLVTYLIKDTRIFNMTIMLGPGTRISSIHEDLYSLGVHLIETKGFTNTYLSLKQREISRMFKKKVGYAEIFGILYTKALIDCMVVHSPTHFGSRAVDTVIGTLMEMFDSMNPIEGSRFHFKTDILRTTDFFSKPGDRNNWLCDCFDSICQTGWFPKRSIPTQKLLNKVMTHFGPLAAIAAKINYFGDGSVNVKFKNRGKLTLRRSDDRHIPGVVDIDRFVPLSEDDLDEYEFSIGLEERPEDEVSMNEKGRAPPLKYLQKNMSDKNSLRWVRGSAWELFIFSNTVTKEMARLCRIFTKADFKGYRDYLSHGDSVIYYVGDRKGKIEISGYSEVPFEKKMSLMNYTVFNNDTFFDVDGNKYSKEEAFSNNYMMGSVYSKINALWGRVSVDETTQERVRSVYSHAVQHYPEDNPIIQTMEKYASILEAEKTKGSSEVVTVEAESFESMISDLVQSIMNEGFFDSIKGVEFDNPDIRRMETLMRYKPENYMVDKRMEILTDDKVRAEIETISPGLCAKLFSREAMLTKRSKNTLLKMSRRSTVTERNKDLKKRKARVHLVVSTILGSIVETNLVNREDTGLFRDLTNLIVEMDEESEDEVFPSLLELEPPIDDIEISIDYSDFISRTFR